MPSLSIRKIEDDVYKCLKSRAASRGHSMEEEVRRIMKLAVIAPERLCDLAVATRNARDFQDSGIAVINPFK